MSGPYQHARRRSRAISTAELLPPVTELPAWRRVLLPPDPLQMDAGAEGELLVARVRTVLIVLLLPIPVINMILDPGNMTSGVIGLAAGILGLALAVGAQVLLRRDFYRPWLGLATSLLDVSCVSMALAAFLPVGQAITTVNSRLLFEVYFVAIGATALRYDARISLAAGALAILQYGGLVALAYLGYDVGNPELEQYGYGAFDWATQVSRLVLLAVATLLSLAIVFRSQRLRRQSRSDRLTGLPNRGYFDERVDAELSRARRYGEPVALLMLDVDHFKKFNDTYGHQMGDRVLRIVAAEVKRCVRLSDVACRYGGEEFAVILPATDVEGAKLLAERIRTRISELRIPYKDGHLEVTCSVGLSCMSLSGARSTKQFIEEADAALYEAKKGGRNRVCVAKATRTDEGPTGSQAIRLPQTSTSLPVDPGAH